MKEIQAIIQKFKFADVTDAVQQIPGVGGITAVEVRGFGVQRGKDGLEQVAVGSINYVAKVMVMVVVPDALAGRVTDAIQKAAHTGNVGDGKIFVLPVEEAVRIRTNARREEALS